MPIQSRWNSLRRRLQGRWKWWMGPVLVGLAAIGYLIAGPLREAAAAEQDAQLEGVAHPSRGAQAPLAADPSDLSKAAHAASAASGAMTPEERREQLALWQERLDHSYKMLEAYSQASRYPDSSRPSSERADQMYPNASLDDEVPFHSSDGKPVDGVLLHTTQERIYVQGEESVLFTISARDGAGKTVPLRVLHASAREVPPDQHTGATHPDVPMDFNDFGMGADVQAGDGVFCARLQPGTQGFGTFFGALVVEATLQYQGVIGSAQFDIVYTPGFPATWQRTGVREEMVDGSLVFDIQADVKEAGHYIATGRIDDADGKPFALLRVDDDLEVGQQELKFTLFGKLVRDGMPKFPLVLRDLDGYLLLPDAFPDRQLMPRLPGTVYTSRERKLSDFSNAEWNSEVRDRYLGKFSQDISDAQAQVGQLQSGP
jgi:hypothetical protein